MVKYHKLSISIGEDEYERVQELKKIFNQKTNSKVIRKLIRYGKI